jgi:hypothetical protein
MAILSFKTSTYARNIFLTGSNRLTARDGCVGVPTTPDNYYTAVIQYAAKTYYIEQIDTALNNGWINEQEHAEVMALKTANDPQHMPETVVQSNE